MDKGQFYTKPEVSQHLTARLMVLLGHLSGTVLDQLLFIEPSAGYGCFYDSVSDMG